MRRLLSFSRFILVTLGIIVLTSISIDATDMFGRSQSALSIIATKLTEATCPAGMVNIALPESSVCIDVYEVSPHSACPYTQPGEVAQTALNINEPKCIGVSVQSAQPWTHVAQVQAEQLCAKAGKRLPTAEEWYVAARGTPDTLLHCNLDNALAKTGSQANCVSGSGVYDMVGNVWEWVGGMNDRGYFNDRLLPASGFVAAVDTAGVARETSSTPQLIYNDDYFWSRDDARYLLMRGGFHGSKNDGGMYAVHAHMEDTFSSATIGFRCVQDL